MGRVSKHTKRFPSFVEGNLREWLSELMIYSESHMSLGRKARSRF